MCTRSRLRELLLLGALFCSSASACSAMLPAYETVSRDVAESNARSRLVGINAVLASERLSLVDAPRASISLGPDFESCGADQHAEADLVLGTIPGFPPQLRVEVCPFREFARGGTSTYRARAPDGTTVTLARASDLDMHATSDSNIEGYALARREDGSIVLLVPTRDVQERRRAYRAGTCDHMPSPGSWMMASFQVFALPEPAPEQLEFVRAPYRAAVVDVTCERNVY